MLARFSARQGRPWGPLSLLYNRYRVFPRVKYGGGVLLTTHPLLVPWSWKSRAISLPTLWATTGPVTGTLYFTCMDISAMPLTCTSGVRHRKLQYYYIYNDVPLPNLTLILPRSRTGTVWFYTSTSNKRVAGPKLYTKSLTRDLKRMYSRFTLVRISIKL